MIIWIYGRPSSGKTTVATGLVERLEGLGQKTFHLDGDCIRKTLSSDLGYTPEDRLENVRRIASLARIIHDRAKAEAEEDNILNHVIVSSIAPMKSHRELIRSILSDVFLVRMEASLEACKKRDVKGLYKKGAVGIELFESSDEDFSVPTVGICKHNSINLVLEEVWKRI